MDFDSLGMLEGAGGVEHVRASSTEATSVFQQGEENAALAPAQVEIEQYEMMGAYGVPLGQRRSRGRAVNYVEDLEDPERAPSSRERNDGAYIAVEPRASTRRKAKSLAEDKLVPDAEEYLAEIDLEDCNQPVVEESIVENILGRRLVEGWTEEKYEDNLKAYLAEEQKRKELNAKKKRTRKERLEEEDTARRKEQDKFEFLVKWRNKSYLHVSWIKPEEIDADVNGAQRLKRYVNGLPPEGHSWDAIRREKELTEYFDPSYVEVDRVLDERFGDPADMVQMPHWLREAHQCLSKLTTRWSHGRKLADYFMVPVDEQRDGAPGYYSIIKKSMDFGTIKEKLRTKQYSSLKQFAADVRLIFSNCRTFNVNPDTDVRHCSDRLEEIFENRMEAFQEKYGVEDEEEGNHDVKRDQPVYLVKWKGLSYADATWETKEDIDDDNAIAAYRKRNQIPSKRAVDAHTALREEFMANGNASSSSSLAATVNNGGKHASVAASRAKLEPKSYELTKEQKALINQPRQLRPRQQLDYQEETEAEAQQQSQRYHQHYIAHDPSAQNAFSQHGNIHYAPQQNQQYSQAHQQVHNTNSANPQNFSQAQAHLQSQMHHGNHQAYSQHHTYHQTPRQQEASHQFQQHQQQAPQWHGGHQQPSLHQQSHQCAQHPQNHPSQNSETQKQQQQMHHYSSQSSGQQSRQGDASNLHHNQQQQQQQIQKWQAQANFVDPQHQQTVYAKSEQQDVQPQQAPPQALTSQKPASVQGQFWLQTSQPSAQDEQKPVGTTDSQGQALGQHKSVQSLPTEHTLHHEAGLIHQQQQQQAVQQVQPPNDEKQHEQMLSQNVGQQQQQAVQQVQPPNMEKQPEQMQFQNIEQQQTQEQPQSDEQQYMPSQQPNQLQIHQQPQLQQKQQPSEVQVQVHRTSSLKRTNVESAMNQSQPMEGVGAPEHVKQEHSEQRRPLQETTMPKEHGFNAPLNHTEMQLRIQEQQKEQERLEAAAAMRKTEEEMLKKKAGRTEQFTYYTKSPEFKDGLELRSYQLEGLNWLAFNYQNGRGSMLADEMGLGKTCQTVSFVKHLQKYGSRKGWPCLVVAPLSTLGHWRNECERWTDLNAVIYHDSGNRRKTGKEARDLIRQYEFYYYRVNERTGERKKVPYLFKFDVLVTSYEALTADGPELSEVNWDAVIVDEGHRLKTRNSKLARTFDDYVRANVRVVLTGTPLQNNVGELWALLNFIEPREFPDKDQFLEEFGDMKDADQVKRLQDRLKPYMLRRLKEHVEKDIPAKEETVIDVELTITQKKYYRAIFERNRGFLGGGAGSLTARGNSPQLISIEMELRKCCNHPYLIQGVEHREAYEHNLRQGTPEYLEHSITSSGKMILLDKLMTKLWGENRMVLIFSQFKMMLDIIQDYCKKRKYPVERIDGNVSANNRQKAIDRFCDPDVRSFAFLLSTRAGGVGINLTAADTVIIFDSDWNPQSDLQAMARCHRIGQKKSVNVYRFVTRGTYESQLFDRAARKLGLEQAVLGNKSAVESQPSKEEIEDLLKHGAYRLLEDDEETARKQKEYSEANIEDLLQVSRKVNWDKAAGNESGAAMSFSKASFVAKGSDKEISVEDKNFWTKVLGEDPRHTMINRLEDGSAYETEEKKKLFFAEIRHTGHQVIQEKLRGNPNPEFEGSVLSCLQMIAAMKSTFTEEEVKAAAQFIKQIERPSRRNYDSRKLRKFYSNEIIPGADEEGDARRHNMLKEALQDVVDDPRDANAVLSLSSGGSKKKPKRLVDVAGRTMEMLIIQGKWIDPVALKEAVDEFGGYEKVVVDRLWQSVRKKLDLRETSSCGHQIHKAYKKYFYPDPSKIPKLSIEEARKKNRKKKGNDVSKKKKGIKRKLEEASKASTNSKKVRRAQGVSSSSSSSSVASKTPSPAGGRELASAVGPWCRYCGVTSGSFSQGPWGPRTLCAKHAAQYQAKIITFHPLQLEQDPKTPIAPHENTLHRSMEKIGDDDDDDNEAEVSDDDDDDDDDDEGDDDDDEEEDNDQVMANAK